LHHGSQPTALKDPRSVAYLKLKIMAKQKGIIKIEGTIGDITFVKTKDGYITTEKTSMSGSTLIDL
jgi:hypothetical protein